MHLRGPKQIAIVRGRHRGAQRVSFEALSAKLGGRSGKDAGYIHGCARNAGRRRRRERPDPSRAVPPTVEIYGFGQADAIADFKQNNPDWYDTVRPSRLPNVANQFGQDGHFYLSARQSRLGAKATLPTSSGDVKAQFEFDMAGVGRDAGLTTIRLRHAWGQ
jgi:hypothetical protein